MATTIKIRRDTAANWTANNPLMALGEPGFETDTRKIKFGNGTQRWASLSYVTVDFPTTIASATTATNITGGATNKLVYQTGTGSTGFINTPVGSNVYLQWTGSAFTWSSISLPASQLTGNSLPVSITGSSLTSVGSLTNLIVTGSITGTLVTAIQPNITSLGTLGTLDVIGNITGTIATPAQTSITSVGTLTGLTSSGAVNITNSTASSSYTTGALKVTGGVGITGNTYIHGNLVVDGQITTNTGETVIGNETVTGTITAGGVDVKSIAAALAIALQ
jgi:hypothetical protein